MAMFSLSDPNDMDVTILRGRDRWGLKFHVGSPPTIHWNGLVEDRAERLNEAFRHTGDRTERPDFGVLGDIDKADKAATLSENLKAHSAERAKIHGVDTENNAIDETLKAAGLDEACETLPSSPALCATLDEVRRYADTQTGGRYAPAADAAVALGLIKALAGIVDRLRQKPQAEPAGENEVEEIWRDRNNRQAALDFAIRARPGFGHEQLTKDAEAFYAFLNGKPSGKVYATKADVVALHERIDGLKPKADDGGWTVWSGGECPISTGALFDVVHRDGTVTKHPDTTVGTWYWGNTGSDADIVAYRLTPLPA